MKKFSNIMTTRKLNKGAVLAIISSVLIFISAFLVWADSTRASSFWGSYARTLKLSLIDVMEETSEIGLVLVIVLFLLAAAANAIVKFFKRSVLLSVAVVIITLMGIGVTVGYVHKAAWDAGIGESLALWGAILLAISIFLDKDKIESAEEPVSEEKNEESVEQVEVRPVGQVAAASVVESAPAVKSTPAVEPQPAAVVKDDNEAKVGKAADNHPEEESEDDDYEADEYEESHSRRWWYIGGVAALLLIAGVVLFLTLGQKKKSHSYYDDDEEEETEMVERHHDKKLNLYGKIDQYPIVMKLTISGNKVKGSYYYESQGPDKVLNLSGIYDDGEMDLYETDEDGRQTGHFKGYIDDGEFSGNFTTMQGTKLSFRLRE